jgi:hypothetical protein
MTEEKKRLIPAIVDGWNDLWRKKPQPTPDKPAVPDSNGILLLRIGLILKSIPFKQLGPVFFTVPALLFFAISGLIAWIMVVLRFAINIFDALV